MKNTIGRRRFLGTGAGLLLLPSARSAFGYPAHERLNLAVVGVAGYAAAAAFLPSLHLYPGATVAALCDVDESKIPKVHGIWEEKSKGPHPEPYASLLKDRPAFFADYRRMLDEAGDRIDAVVVATPDHSHAAIAAACLRAGKHVFAEKPLAISVREARALRALAAERRLATSMGNQGTQHPGFRRGVELLRGGAIGDVEEVHLWFSRGGKDHAETPQGTAEVPAGFHWDLWLGPAASRPYHPRWIARNDWRDTSAGELGNFGPHTGNLAFTGLNLRDLWTSPGEPIRVKAECSGLNRISFPRWEIIRWKIPARGAMKPLTLSWHHAPQPRLPEGSREMLAGRLRDAGASPERVDAILKGPGVLFVGSKGLLVSNSHNTEVALLPESRFKDVEQKRPASLPASRGHYQDWIAACRGGAEPWSNFGHAASFMELLMLGPVATLLDKEIAYDPVAGRLLNAPEASLGPEPRTGFGI